MSVPDDNVVGAVKLSETDILYSNCATVPYLLAKAMLAWVCTHPRVGLSDTLGIYPPKPLYESIHSFLTPLLLFVVNYFLRISPDSSGDGYWP